MPRHVLHPLAAEPDLALLIPEALRYIAVPCAPASDPPWPRAMLVGSAAEVNRFIIAYGGDIAGAFTRHS